MGNARLELWLVRHGETTRSRDGRLAGWADVRLTSRGRDEARSVAPLLAGRSFDGVWCSDLTRARVTARLAWGTASPDRRLREIDFGALERQRWTALESAHRESLMAFEGFRAPGGESLEQLAARVNDFLAGLVAGSHLLFTHGGVIRLLTRQAGEDRFPPTGSVTVLDWARRRIAAIHRAPRTA